MTTATTGTGTITLGSAVSAHLTFAQAGVQNGDTVSYALREGTNSEVGRGVYSSTGPTLTRSVLKSTNGNNAISLLGRAQVSINALAEDFENTSYVSVEDYGAACDGSTDDSAAIALALDAINANGGGVLLIPGFCAVASTIVVGDGTNSAPSTKHHRITIRGIGRGSGADVTNVQATPASGFKYTGTTSTSAAVLRLAGPLTNISIENLQLDCDNKAGIGLECIHVTDLHFDRVNVVKYTTTAYLHTTRTGYPTGAAYGNGNGVQLNCNAYSPSNNTATAIKLTSGVNPATTLAGNPDTANLDIIGGVYIYGGSTGSYGIHLHGADNNSIEGAQFIPAGGNDSGGKSVYFEQWAGWTVFPLENVFKNLGASQAVGGTSGTGGNIFLPMCTSDGLTPPTSSNLPSLTAAGKFYAADGTAASPSISFAADQDSGIYSVSAGIIGFSANGTRAGYVQDGGFVAERNGAVASMVTARSDAHGVASIGTFDSYGLNSTSASTLYSRILVQALDNTAASEDGSITFQTMAAGSLTSIAYAAAGVFAPATTDGAALGSASNRWSDLFGATGFVLNLNSDWVATHTAGILTVGTGDLRVTTAGSDATSVVTVGGTQTLTNKTLTSPTLTTPALGTPSSGTLTSCTGLPISTGVTGLGTGVATALAVNIGSAGAFVTFGGALGTPSSGTLTNCTGLPVAGISGLGTGVATFLATPSSANLATVVTDETGSGSLVFATSPTLTTPNIGTPSAGTLTNCTGLPIGGITGLGTGVATALAVNVGSAGAFVTFGGALGTPSSGTLTNCTGLPISTGVSGLGSGVATFLATPSSANLASAVSDETGSGALVFGTSPTFTTQITSPKVIGGSAASSSLVLQSTSGTGTSDSIQMLVGSNGGTTGIHIDTSGNVGIGTAPSFGILDITKSQNSQLTFRVNNQNSGASAAAAFYVQTNAGTYQVVSASTAGGATCAHDWSGTGTLYFTASNAAGRIAFRPGGYTERFSAEANGNFVFAGGGQANGEKIMAIGNASTVPSTNPSGGGILYAEGGALKWRGSSGTVTTIANA